MAYISTNVSKGDVPKVEVPKIEVPTMKWHTPYLLEGSKILCQVAGKDTYLPVETLQKGALVKTGQGYKAIFSIAKLEIENPGNSDRIEKRLYKYSPSSYPDLTDPLYITGGHCTLIESFTALQIEATRFRLGPMFVIGNRYRLPAVLDERAEPWASAGKYWVWNLALENEDRTKNYGIWANGLFVESCRIDFM